MSRSFALGSSQVGLPGECAGPIDLISWDLHWRGEKHQAKITCNHPICRGKPIQVCWLAVFDRWLMRTGMGGGKAVR